MGSPIGSWRWAESSPQEPALSSAERLTRREFLAGATIATLATLPALASCAGSADAPPGSSARITTQLTYLLDVTFAGWYLADTEGFLRNEGVSSRLLPYGANVPATTAVVAGGQAEVGLSTIRDVIEANRQGADLMVFGTQFQKSPGGLVSLVENPVRTIHDVIGKRIGLDPSGQATLNVALDNAGLPHDYKVVNVSGDPQPLVDGQVDAMAVFVTSQPITLDRRGVRNVAVTFNDLGFPSYENVLVARRETMEEDKDLLARYLRAVIKGWELNRQDLEAGARKTFELHGKDNSLDLAQQTKENELQMPLMESALTDEKGLFQMSLEDIAGPQYQALRRAGVNPLPEPRSFITLEILDAAYGGRPSLLG
jgi:ABC-type nitrate/sulfonate/bicarbonate transport system substrate-binding protein